MKLFVIAALVAVAAAARLEHLENRYLPPFRSNGGFGAAGAGGNFAGATSNQYLPPDHGPSANNGEPQFAGSLTGFGGQQNYPSQQYGGQQGGLSQQYLAPRSQFGSPQAGSSFGSPSYQQYGQQSAATNRQYLAPSVGSYQQPPQQAFDEQTGYQY
ncbi:hypothetical protein PYW07_005568 [Mythimna separata]|uniref:Uncharacterized protein n=1 Tax=Mythimna separata TaxID=271217 RepID=A0AAD7YIB0_MYTSE|nr:hypothetical protein PYW07_005568 [Mythimna separata]